MKCAPMFKSVTGSSYGCKPTHADGAQNVFDSALYLHLPGGRLPRAETPANANTANSLLAALSRGVISSGQSGRLVFGVHAEDGGDREEYPLAIYNIDTYVDPAAMDFTQIRGQGWIPCFPGEGDKWSFAAADQNGRISEVREKLRISRHASVGLYWFDSFSRYEDAYKTY